MNYYMKYDVGYDRTMEYRTIIQVILLCFCLKIVLCFLDLIIFYLTNVLLYSDVPLKRKHYLGKRQTL